LEEGLTGALGHDRRADALKAGKQLLPGLCGADRVCTDKPQRGATAERLGKGHARAYAIGFGKPRDLADCLSGTRQWSKGKGLLEPAGASHGEQEAGNEDAGHHTNTCSHRKAGPPAAKPPACLIRLRRLAAQLRALRHRLEARSPGHYNFARPHKALKERYPRTPAMAAGMIDLV
jgi:hypothetical protein